MYRRFVPSGEALYPSELYIYLKTEDLPSGVYHYDVAHHIRYHDQSLIVKYRDMLCHSHGRLEPFGRHGTKIIRNTTAHREVRNIHHVHSDSPNVFARKPLS
jgi:hypothetical protein